MDSFYTCFTSCTYKYREKVNYLKLDDQKFQFPVVLSKHTIILNRSSDISNLTPSIVHRKTHTGAQTYPAAIKVDTRERNPREVSFCLEKNCLSCYLRSEKGQFTKPKALDRVEIVIRSESCQLEHSPPFARTIPPTDG